MIYISCANMLYILFRLKGLVDKIDLKVKSSFKITQANNILVEDGVQSIDLIIYVAKWPYLA